MSYTLPDTALRDLAQWVLAIPEARQRLVGFAEASGIDPDAQWSLVLTAGELRLVDDQVSDDAPAAG